MPKMVCSGAGVCGDIDCFLAKTHEKTGSCNIPCKGKWVCITEPKPEVEFKQIFIDDSDNTIDVLLSKGGHGGRYYFWTTIETTHEGVY